MLYSTIIGVDTLEDQPILTLSFGQPQVPVYGEHIIIADALHLIAV